MTMQVINIGALPNDGEGDPLRVAFQKVNNNFASLFATGFSVAESTTVGLAPDQVVLEHPANIFTQGMIQIRSYDPTTPDFQNVMLSAAITNDSLGVKFSGYAITTEGNALCQYDMDVSDGNVRLLINPILDTVIYHYMCYQITGIDLVAGTSIALDGYPTGSLISTQSNVVISTETLL